MRNDCFDVLCEVVRIANRAEPDFSRACKAVLQQLQQASGFADAELFLCDNQLRGFSERLAAGGPLFFQPCNLPVEGLAATALSCGHLLHGDSCLVVPLCHPLQARGVLILSLPSPCPSSPSFERLCETVALQLSCLLQRRQIAADEQRRLAQLDLISNLGKSLNKAESVQELLRTASHIVQSHADAYGAVLRPIYGNTLLGDPIVKIPEARPGLLKPLLAIEDELAAQALEGGSPLFEERALPVAENGEVLLMAVATIPLVSRHQVVGIFTLFEGSETKTLALAADPASIEILSLIAEQIAQALERVEAVEQLAELSRQNITKLQEISLLYRISRAMHSTLRLDELMHLVLSAATVESGAGFERAMLFMVNERSGFLQGMLGVVSAEAAAVLPADRGLAAWNEPLVSPEVREAQRNHPFCRQVSKQRLSLEETEHPLVQAIRQERVLLVSAHEQKPASFADLKARFGIGHCACAPLVGHDRVLGVLLVDSPGNREGIDSERRRFLGLFANQAAQAMENSLLLQRLEESHRHLRETQEQMIQVEKMAALGETAASVTHELRNPLVSVGGYANRLARLMPSESKAYEYSQIIVREVRRMEEMLTNILAFSKKQMLCLVDCHLQEILFEVLALEMEALQRASIILREEIAQDLPPIQADEQKLRQVLLNLIANARQAMATGGVLTIRAYAAVLRGDPAVALEVEDTGGGIEPSVMRNIFNPFFTTRQDGTGLGLSIVHRIIEHHHGDVEVVNGERGARFILRLAVAQIEKKPRLPAWSKRS